jgi:hypothetical protein
MEVHPNPRTLHRVSLLHVFAGRASSKRFPNLHEFLRKLVEERLTRKNRLSSMVGCGLVGIAAPIAALAFGLGFASVGAGLLAATLAVPLSAYAWYLVDKKLRSPRTPEEARRMEAWKGAASLLTLEQQRRLHKQMDPSMSQLLEAAAYHYMRIDAAVSSEFWNRDSLPAHWRSVRSQAVEAADQAMEELVMLSLPCMGEPQADKGKVFKEAVEDLFEMDFLMAIGNLKQIASSDWTKYAHKSANAPLAFTAARPIAERLKKLADQVEAMASEAAVSSGTYADAATAADSIDVVLSEIAAVKQAEDELQQRIGDGGI